MDLTSSSDTSNLKHLESKASGVASSADAMVAEERAILQDRRTSLVRKTDIDYFGDMGVCANYSHQPHKGTELKQCSSCHITRYCSTECQKKDWGFQKFACSFAGKQSATKT